ncbi:MAG: TusE/DsrC/DsvC family sulfur relay protein [Rhodobacteraceae bacterium]|nr:TusE/DsrC/DsvC family sulfur relay protein [Paracoccaceae bacterium]
MRTRAEQLAEIELGNGQKISVDEAGYLTNIDDWSEDFARHLANQEGIELTDLHWEIFEQMREYYDLNGVAMDQRFILKFLSKKFAINKADAKAKLFEHFPYGYIKQAVKMAGMRQPRGWSTG